MKETSFNGLVRVRGKLAKVIKPRMYASCIVAMFLCICGMYTILAVAIVVLFNWPFVLFGRKPDIYDVSWGTIAAACGAGLYHLAVLASQLYPLIKP